MEAETGPGTLLASGDIADGTTLAEWRLRSGILAMLMDKLSYHTKIVETFIDPR